MLGEISLDFHFRLLSQQQASNSTLKTVSSCFSKVALNLLKSGAILVLGISYVKKQHLRK